jgi:hypothetical protein
MTDRELLE